MLDRKHQPLVRRGPLSADIISESDRPRTHTDSVARFIADGTDARQNQPSIEF
jgi:hypothetical protein